MRETSYHCYCARDPERLAVGFGLQPEDQSENHAAEVSKRANDASLRNSHDDECLGWCAGPTMKPFESDQAQDRGRQSMGMSQLAAMSARTGVAVWYEREVRAIPCFIEQCKDDKDHNESRQRRACSIVDINTEAYRQDALNDPKCEREVFLPGHAVSSIDHVAQIST